MARIRSIKPEFFTSKTLSTLPWRARLTFIGLWTYCDDGGRCQDDPTLIRAALFIRDDDVTDADVEFDLHELEVAGLIERYVGMFRNKERPLLQICGWSEHQRISNPTPSRIPPPISEGSTESLASPTEDLGSPTESPGTGALELGELGEQGNEGSRGEGDNPPAKRRRSRIRAGWLPSDELADAMDEKHPGINARSLVEKFRDFHAAKGSLMIDWDAAFRTWCHNEADWAKGRVAPAEGIRPDIRAALDALTDGAA